MGRIVAGLILFGIGLIVDAFGTMVDISRGSYPDKIVTDKVWDAIAVFTCGFLLLGGIIWLIMIAIG